MLNLATCSILIKEYNNDKKHIALQAEVGLKHDHSHVISREADLNKMENSVGQQPAVAIRSSDKNERR